MLHGVPGARLHHDAGLLAKVDQLAFLADAAIEQDVKLNLAEGRGDLVLDHGHLRTVADHKVAVLQLADAAYVQSNGRVELQRPATGGGLGGAEHDPDLLADLVDEDHKALGA